MDQDNTILVVDDDPQLLAGTARILRQAGYHVVEASTGKEALQCVDVHQPDLVLLDNVLPDIQGLEVCKRLKNNANTSSVFVSILSGTKIKSSDRSNGFDIGADEYITRPIGNRELLARVKTMLRLRNAEKNLAQHRDRLEDLVARRTDDLQQEVAERQQAEQALLESRGFASSVLNSLGAHIAVINNQGEILAVNQAWRGFARENGCVGPPPVFEGANYFKALKKAVDFDKDQFAENALNGIHKVLNEQTPYFSMEYPCHSPSVERFFVMRVQPLENLKSSVVITHENITELKQAEAALRRRSSELAMLNKVGRQASRSLSMQNVVADALDGVILATNASNAFLLLKEGEDLIPGGLVFAENVKEFEEFPVHKLGECLCGKAAMEGKAIYSTDIYNDSRCTWDECKKAGLQSAAALPLFGGDQVIGVLGLGKEGIHDFETQDEYLHTLASAVALGLQNANLFEQTKKHAQHLEDEVKERTRELEESNERLKELDRLKSMFIASMSHELRTPLNSIIGFTGILLQGLAGELNEEQHDQLGRVSRAGKHLLSLITDVIDVSKIEAGKVDLYWQTFKLNDLINDAVSTTRPEAESKGLSLVIECPENIELETDYRRLLQCVMNLLSNGVKYSEQGQLTITARENNEQVEISVSDTGIGIAEDDLTLLFNSFVRLDSHLKTITPGTGLGLYLTRKIVSDLLGGDISAQSTLGKGSTFTLVVPQKPGTDH